MGTLLILVHYGWMAVGTMALIASVNQRGWLRGVEPFDPIQQTSASEHAAESVWDANQRLSRGIRPL